MKKITFSLVLMATTLLLKAQDIKDNTALYNKISQPCVTADYAMSGDIVEGAFVKKMTDNKLKSSKASDGFKVYKGISIPEITNETIDLFYKVDDKKTSATLTVLVSKGNDNFYKKETDSATIQNTKNYLTKFVNDATAFSLNNQIANQQDEVTKLEKKLKGQAKDEEGYTKDKSKIESKINANKIDIEALKSEVEAQQKNLEAVKLKTATVEQMDALKKEVSKQEDITKKASKNYDKALEKSGELKDDLKKAEDKIADSATEQVKTKEEIKAKNLAIDELKKQLAALAK